jgi:hypothetical protein
MHDSSDREAKSIDKHFEASEAHGRSAEGDYLDARTDVRPLQPQLGCEQGSNRSTDGMPRDNDVLRSGY